MSFRLWPCLRSPKLGRQYLLWWRWCKRESRARIYWCLPTPCLALLRLSFGCHHLYMCVQAHLIISSIWWSFLGSTRRGCLAECHQLSNTRAEKQEWIPNGWKNYRPRKQTVIVWWASTEAIILLPFFLALYYAILYFLMKNEPICQILRINYPWPTAWLYFPWVMCTPATCFCQVFYGDYVTKEFLKERRKQLKTRRAKASRFFGQN